MNHRNRPRSGSASRLSRLRERVRARATNTATAVIVLGIGLLLSGGCARKTAPLLSYSDGNAEAVRTVLQSGLDTVACGGGPSMGDPSGWATLSGTFVIDGAPPARAPLSITKDQDVCAPGGQQVLDESVVIGPSGGIQNVLVFVSSKLPKDDPKWEHESYLESKFGEVEFDQKNCIFLTHVAAYRATQKVKVLNSDPVGHNTNIDSKRGAAGGNFTVPANSFSLYEPGAASPAPFGVSCSIHPWMKSWMMISDNAYFAVTDADGRFEIKYVPAGVELEYRVWQEKSKYLQQVAVNGQAQKWSKGKFKLTLSADETHELSVSVNRTVFQ